MSWLATLVAHLDNPDSFTGDAPVCVHRLHMDGGSGALWGVQAVVEAVFHTFDLAIDEVTEVAGVAIFRVVIVVVILLEIPLF